ncbi:phosphate ABC transporter substrate-binding protein PstS [Alloscardovia venturai]|uniref:Phosphate-binding protein n=1 Tax=Alloscardovia venturai TaxID=1769421 RepID=A0ABW2Y633_9BIFI
MREVMRYLTILSRASAWRRVMSATLAGVVVFSLAACGDNVPNASLTQTSWSQENLTQLSGEFAGAGASSQKSAVDAWIVGYSAAQKNVTISYDPSGSGAGVNTFLTGALSWAGTDAPLSDAQVKSSREVCASGTAFDMPTYVSPIALTYNLSQYGLNDAHIQLSAQTIAKIFQGIVAYWDDVTIKTENPQIASKLPHIEITPVWRSDKSGTTKTFQTYLHAAAPTIWRSEPSETWPNTIGQGAKGTPGVVMTTQQAQGTIGYADFSQVGELGTVSVKVGDSYVAPSPAATAKLIAAASLKTGLVGKNRFVLDIDYATTSQGVYPIALVSYDVACQTYASKRTAEFVKQWLTYILSDAGQKIAQDNAGSAQLPARLRTRMMHTVNSITAKEAQ